MAQKKITDFSLRTDFDETCNLVLDDTTQTWRATGQQVKDYVRALELVSVVSEAVELDVTDGGARVTGDSEVTMPDATLCAGREYFVKKIDAIGTTTDIVFQGGQNADGETALELTERYSYFRMVSNGTNFDIIGAG